MDDKEARHWHPTLVFVDSKNVIQDIKSSAEVAV
jgi:aspartate 1-decarboxylase